MKIKVNGLLALLLLLTSCAKASKDITMMVVSDTHLMSPELLKNDGKAFTDYVSRDRKMLKESPMLMEKVTENILKQHPQYLLITGDLTKDGETVSHKMLCDKYLKRIKSAGIQVFVIPGNHDVDNPHAVEFDGNVTRRVPTPKADEFAKIYNDYGYGQAIARDTSSLSYVVQLSEDVRLLCLDACEYENNSYKKNICVTAGRLKKETVSFIKEQAKDARKKGMRMLAMMHHGIVQHWTWQEKAMREYLVDKWRKHADMLSRLGIKIVFTGHFHSQDISKRGSLYDIETGSLVSYPSPYRTVTLSGNKLIIKTKHLTGTGMGISGGKSFGEYAKDYARTGIYNIVGGMLPKTIPDSIRKEACDIISDAYLAHLGGDEKMPSGKQQLINATAAKIKKYSWKYAYIFKHISKYLWTDLTPEDNNIVINL